MRCLASGGPLCARGTSYTYDALNRLTSAANSAWSEAYTYDGFENLLTKTGTGGAPNPAQSVSLSYNAKNQPTNTTFDANGNSGRGGPTCGNTYTVENRVTMRVTNCTDPYPHQIYAYDPWGKRVMSGSDASLDSPQPQYTYTFYGITGQALATLECNGSDYPSYPICAITGQSVYFGKKILVSGGVNVVTDRLGSVRANGQGETFAYFPYGEERTSTVDGRPKFGTYFRDAVGQDYADQRYYNAGMGSFWTVDPGGVGTAVVRRPASWNRYARAEGDPVNFADPHGLYVVDCVCDGGCANISGNAGNYGGGWGATSGGAVMGGPLWDSESQFESAYEAYVQGSFANPMPTNIPCEQGLVKSVITADIASLGLNLGGYDFANAVASIGGQTSGVLGGGGTDSMTELVVQVNPSDPDAWANLEKSLVADGFNLYTGDTQHPGMEDSYRQNVGQWSMQVSFNPNHTTLNIDIDPFNPYYGDAASLLGHGLDVLLHGITSDDTNYNSVASGLGIKEQPCGNQ